jgi:hypothetical protein
MTQNSYRNLSSCPGLGLYRFNKESATCDREKVMTYRNVAGVAGAKLPDCETDADSRKMMNILRPGMISENMSSPGAFQANAAYRNKDPGPSISFYELTLLCPFVGPQQHIRRRHRRPWVSNT